MRLFAAFDIGGTAIKYGLVQEDGTVLSHDNTPTRASVGKDHILKVITEKVRVFQKNNDLAGIAISSAGVINVDEGKVLHTTNVIKHYDGTPVKSIIEEKTGLVTEINNDVNCFGLCEARIGSAHDVKDALVMTVGTGIGGAIIMNNTLFYGTDYAAGELGYMKIPGGKFETIASMSALVNDAQKTINPSIKDGVEVFTLYDEHHSAARACVNRFYDYLAQGISNLIYIFNPQRIVIGGGISARPTFIDELMVHLEPYCKPEFLKPLEIKAAQYKNLSGIIGAMYHFIDMENKRQLRP